jgi:hypothetical protein
MPNKKLKLDQTGVVRSVRAQKLRLLGGLEITGMQYKQERPTCFQIQSVTDCKLPQFQEGAHLAVAKLCLESPVGQRRNNHNDRGEQN